MDRQGQETPLAAPPRSYVYPRLSPNGARLAFFISDQELDIWLFDLSRSTLTRLTSDPGLENYPVWTPDGRGLVFSSEREGARNLFVQADSAGTTTRLTKSADAQYPTSISPDGKLLVFTEIATKAGDVLQLDLGGTHAVTPLTARRLSMSATARCRPMADGSPTMRTTRVDLKSTCGRFVRTSPRGLWQVSTDGGTRPLWARERSRVVLSD